MDALRFTLCPQTAFATPLQGDTLFGQLCWAIRHGWGAARLNELLAGYTTGQPFVVLSDALPAGHVPLPALPAACWTRAADKADDPSQRKALKKQIWLPESALTTPLPDWQQQAKTPKDIQANLAERHQPHNSINRLTQTTGKGAGFAPYQVSQHWHPPGSVWMLHVRLDSSRFAAADLHQALAAIGESGYGRDASTGLGKFTLNPAENQPLPPGITPNAWLTLAPCAPQGLGLDARRSFYRPFTRYGRHGDVAALSGQPFKQPLLLTATGALLTPQQEQDWSRGWIGQGLGGGGKAGTLSSVLPATVHQGYAPALPVCLPETLCHPEAA